MVNHTGIGSVWCTTLAIGTLTVPLVVVWTAIQYSPHSMSLAKRTYLPFLVIQPTFFSAAISTVEAVDFEDNSNLLAVVLVVCAAVLHLLFFLKAFTEDKHQQAEIAEGCAFLLLGSASMLMSALGHVVACWLLLATTLMIGFQMVSTSFYVCFLDKRKKE